jgi:hypothetical protein
MLHAPSSSRRIQPRSRLENAGKIFLVIWLTLWALTVPDEFAGTEELQVPQVTLKMTYLAQPTQPLRLKDLLPESERPRTLSVVSSVPLLAGRLIGEGELAYSAPEIRLVEGRGDAKHRLVRYVLNGREGPLRYEVSYRSAGKAFTAMPDQAAREAWGEWQWGVARMRASLRESWNNVEQDPRQARLTHLQERLTLVVTPPAWGEATLAFSRNSAVSSYVPPVGVAQRWQIDSVEGAYAYTGLKWHARWAASYSVTSDQLRPGGVTAAWAHTLSGSYKFGNALALTPTLSLREERQRWSGILTETPAAALALTYASGQHYHFNTVGSYSRTHSSDHLLDLSTFAVQSTVTRTFQEAGSLRTTFSLEAGFKETDDAVNPTRSTQEVSGLLRLHVEGFSLGTLGS